MKDYRLLLFPLACWLMLFTQSQAQTLTYEVYKGSSKIGEMDVNRQYSNGTWTYSSDSRVSVSFLVTVNLQFIYEATFSNNTLQKSLAKNIRDGKVRDASVGHREGNSYITDINGDKKVTNDPSIDYCVLTSYYKEPKGRTELFSERWGKYIKVKDLGNHKYAFVLPNGDENHMIYENGVCTMIQINHTLATLRFKLKPNIPSSLVSE